MTSAPFFFRCRYQVRDSHTSTTAPPPAAAPTRAPPPPAAPPEAFDDGIKFVSGCDGDGDGDGDGGGEGGDDGGDDGGGGDGGGGATTCRHNVQRREWCIGSNKGTLGA